MYIEKKIGSGMVEIVAVYKGGNVGNRSTYYISYKIPFLQIVKL